MKTKLLSMWHNLLVTIDRIFTPQRIFALTVVTIGINTLVNEGCVELCNALKLVTSFGVDHNFIGFIFLFSGIALFVVDNVFVVSLLTLPYAIYACLALVATFFYGNTLTNGTLAIIGLYLLALNIINKKIK